MDAVRDDGFEQALAERPADRGLRLVYADWLEERGQDAYAAAHRWLARRGKYPVACRMVEPPGPTLYLFGRRAAGQFRPDLVRCLLPDDLQGRMAGRVAAADRAGTVFAAVAAGEHPPVRSEGGWWLYFRTPRQAVEELAAALAAGV